MASSERRRKPKQPPAQGSPRELLDMLFRTTHPAIFSMKSKNRRQYLETFFPEQLHGAGSATTITSFLNCNGRSRTMARALHELLTASPHALLEDMRKRAALVLTDEHGEVQYDQAQLRRKLSLFMGTLRPEQPEHLFAALRSHAATGERIAAAQIDADFLPLIRRGEYDAVLSKLLLLAALDTYAAGDYACVFTDDPISAVQLEANWRTQALKSSLTAEEHLLFGNRFLAEHDYENAFRHYSLGYEKSSGDRNITYSECSFRLYRLYQRGYGVERNPSKALQHLESSVLQRAGCLSGFPEALLTLSQYYRDHPHRESVAKHLCRVIPLLEAAMQTLPAAAYELGNLYLYGDASLELDSDPARAVNVFDEGLRISATPHDRGRLLCAKGCALQELGRLPQARACLKEAWGFGNKRAYQLLLRLNIPGHMQTKNRCLIPFPTKNACFINGESGLNMSFVHTLPEAHTFTPVNCCAVTPDAEHFLFADVSKALFSLDLPKLAAQNGRIIFGFFSDDRQANVLVAVRTLEALHEIALTMENPQSLIRAVDLFVAGERHFGTLMLDSVMSAIAMNRLYFRFRLLDEAFEGALSLLTNAPLFLPQLRDPRCAQTHAVILGDSAAAYEILRMICALGCVGEDVPTAALLAPNACELEQRLYTDCPGLCAKSPALLHTRPAFVDCDLRSGLHLLCDTQPGSATALLKRGNYFVVATDDDEFNLRLAIQLRSRLLINSLDYTQLPLIAVHISNPNISTLARGLVVANVAAAPEWTSDYGFVFFGCSAELFTLPALDGDPYEACAHACHMRWVGTDDEEMGNLHYYSRQYNRVSSKLQAIYTPYRVFNAGLLSAWQQSTASLSMLADAYRRYLADERNARKATLHEHVRWNCAMLIEGWQPSSLDEIHAYLNAGAPSALLHICKKHPMLRALEEIEKNDSLFYRQVCEAVKRRRSDGRSPSNPSQDDLSSVHFTPSLLELL